MDIFMEHLVQKKKDRKDKLITFLIVMAAICVSLFLIAVMFLLMLNGIPGVGGIGAVFILFTWYGASLAWGTRNIEYEYILTNSELDIDKVMSKKGRKRLLTVDIKNATLMGRIDDSSCNSVYLNPPEGVSMLNYSAMSDTGFTYFIDCLVDEKRTIVLCQPTEKMVDAMWKYNPKAVKRVRE